MFVLSSVIVLHCVSDFAVVAVTRTQLAMRPLEHAAAVRVHALLLDKSPEYGFVMVVEYVDCDVNERSCSCIAAARPERHSARNPRRIDA